jgi:hypothetical protein
LGGEISYDGVFSADNTRRAPTHLAAGKAVISCSAYGLYPERAQFVQKQEWGIRFEPDCDFDPA